MADQGRVLRFASDFFYVFANGRLVTCKARGKIKSRAQHTDIIAIGDFVTFEPLICGCLIGFLVISWKKGKLRGSVIGEEAGYMEATQIGRASCRERV